jgi:putative N6-adenine-specific DNA methylase
METFFATCPRGLEGVLAAELAGIGVGHIEAADGGVEFSGGHTHAYRANLETRVASRVLWRVSRAPYRSEREIYDTVRAQPWASWFSVRHTLRVDVAAVRSPVKSLDFVTLRVKDAVCDAFRAATGARPDVDTRSPHVRIHVFLTASECSVYIDTSGEALFKRGYRRTGGEAPLRENLAAGILLLAGWTPGTPLLDPMCGSGTFLCEAALMALDRAPGLDRSFGFERLEIFEAGAWREIRDAARARVRSPAGLAIYGSDGNADMLKLARANLAALDLAEHVPLERTDVLDRSPPAAAGTLVTNPPYGVRLDDQARLAALYPRLGDALKKSYAGWTAYLFTADLRLPRLIGLAASRRTPLYNGALECRLFEFRIVAGSMRPQRKQEPKPSR